MGTIGGLAEPSAVAVDGEGRIWIAEAFADRVRAFDRDGKEVASIGKTGSAPGELLSPGGLAIAPDGTLYVADSGNHRIQRFSPQGEMLDAFGEWSGLGLWDPPEGAGLNEPLGLVFAGEQLYVADSRHHRVVVFSRRGLVLASIGRRGRAEGEFERPSAVAVDDEGFLYVADSGNHRVQKLDPEGRCVKAWGEFGPWLGFFSDPTGIAWRDEKIYVADRDNHRVQVFDDDGELAYDFGVHALLPREGDGKVHYPDHVALAADGSFLALAESFEDRVQLFAPWTEGEAPAPDPLRFERDQSSHYGGGIAIGGGMMALVEPSAPSLILWDLSLDEPIQVCRHRWYGSKVGQLARPVDVALDPVRHLVHVADPGNHRIATYTYTPRGPDDELKYDPFLLRLVRAAELPAFSMATPLTRTGSRTGNWIEPDALGLAPNGSLLLADVTNRDVLAFSLDLERILHPMWGTQGAIRPVDVAIDVTLTKLYVVDQLGRCVTVLDRPEDPSGPWKLAAPIGGPEEERGGLVRPAGIEVLSDGRTWVSDMARHRICEYGARRQLPSCDRRAGPRPRPVPQAARHRPGRPRARDRARLGQPPRADPDRPGRVPGLLRRALLHAARAAAEGRAADPADAAACCSRPGGRAGRSSAHDGAACGGLPARSGSLGRGRARREQRRWLRGVPAHRSRPHPGERGVLRHGLGLRARRARRAAGRCHPRRRRGHARARPRHEPRAGDHPPRGRRIRREGPALPHGGALGALPGRHAWPHHRAGPARRDPGMRSRTLLLLGAGTLALAASVPRQADEPVTFTEVELRRLLQHSPLEGPPADPTNRVADDPRAARLGQRLFFDPRLSANGEISCATCHLAEKGLADGKPLAEGLGTATRHAPTLWNVAWQRWYFWDGRVDTLWGQALQPLEHPVEMGSSRTALARRVATDPLLRGEFEAVFGPLPAQLDAITLPEQARPVPDDPDHPHARAWQALGDARRAAVEAVAVDALKAIAAYERLLVSRRAPFDVFVEGLREDDPARVAALSPAAQRGAALFVGRAGCRSCHSGPTFSDGEFHDLMLPPLDGGRPSDPGRYAGIERLLIEPLRSAGPHSDDPEGEKARALARLARGPQTFAELKTPTLRNVARTAPYMHQGQLATLDDVLHFYSTLEGQVPTGHHEETILVALELTDAERADLKAFLEALTDESLDPALLAAP